MCWAFLSAQHLWCVFVGGVVPGDELMAVNGKILIDATLSEGQNSLARAWNSGGVRILILNETSCSVLFLFVCFFCSFFFQLCMTEWCISKVETPSVLIDWVCVFEKFKKIIKILLTRRTGLMLWLPCPPRKSMKMKCKHSFYYLCKWRRSDIFYMTSWKSDEIMKWIQ